MSDEEKKPESTNVTQPLRRDRDEYVRKYLWKHPELIPTAADFRNNLPKSSLDELRKGLIEGGWTEYPNHPERSQFPSACLRVSLDRLLRKGTLPERTPNGPRPQGKKTVPKPVAAKVATAKSVPALSERTALIIEAARTGLRVRLLVDGTIEVSP